VKAPKPSGLPATKVMNLGRFAPHHRSRPADVPWVVGRGSLAPDAVRWRGAAASVSVHELEAYVGRLRHGRRASGHAQLKNGETTWTFTPDARWQAGTYQVVARGTLEDPAGNRLGSQFETSIDSAPGQPFDAMVPFSVGRSRRPSQSPRHPG